MNWLTVTECLCYKWPRICSVCCNCSPVFPQSWPPGCNKSSTTGATCGSATTHPSGAPKFTPNFSGFVLVARCLALCVAFCRLLIDLLPFLLLVIVLSVLRFTDSDYQTFHMNPVNVEILITDWIIPLALIIHQQMYRPGDSVKNIHD
jgi:hypothetical protein